MNKAFKIPGVSK